MSSMLGNMVGVVDHQVSSEAVKNPTTNVRFTRSSFFRKKKEEGKHNEN
jgi:hypothetical protein